MAVKLRLARKGRRHSAFYHLVAADARAPRDGRNLGKLGTYNPNKNPAPVELDVDLILAWLRKGAQPTETVRQILSSQGVLLKRHLQMGVDKGVITQAMADERFAKWEKDAAKKKHRPYENASLRKDTQENASTKTAEATPPKASKEKPVAEETKASVDSTQKDSSQTVDASKKAEKEIKTTKAAPSAKKAPAKATKEKSATPNEKDAEKA